MGSTGGWTWGRSETGTGFPAREEGVPLDEWAAEVDILFSGGCRSFWSYCDPWSSTFCLRTSTPDFLGSLTESTGHSQFPCLNFAPSPDRRGSERPGGRPRRPEEARDHEEDGRSRGSPSCDGLLTEDLSTPTRLSHLPNDSGTPASLL